jgi:hypothetical protein
MFIGRRYISIPGIYFVVVCDNNEVDLGETIKWRYYWRLAFHRGSSLIALTP